jgi:hypothetical protein
MGALDMAHWSADDDGVPVHQASGDDVPWSSVDLARLTMHEMFERMLIRQRARIADVRAMSEAMDRQLNQLHADELEPSKDQAEEHLR